LLKLLAAHRGHVVAMDDIVEVLWGDEAPAKAEANVATLVSRLRGVVGADAVVGGRTGYRLGVGPGVRLDIDEAEELVDEAERRLAADQSAIALTAATRATQLLAAGRAIEDEPGAEWAMHVGREVERLLRRGRVVAWEAHAAVGDHRGALAAAQAAVDADGLDEEAHRAVIRAYYRLGEQGEALRAYERVRATLVEELGADPGPETAALFEAVLRGDDVADEPRSDSAPPRGEPDFVGRDPELQELLGLWSHAIRGNSSCVLVTGEAGIGKTRLAAEFAAAVRATGATVLRARCYEAERSLYLQPVIEVVREATSTVAPEVVRRAVGDRAGSLSTLVPELSATLGAVASGSAASEIERRRTFEAVAQLLGGLARAGPLLVVLDDLQEAGASTVELLHFALRWDARAPLMVVATIREHEADYAQEQLAPLATTIELAGLSDEAIKTLADKAGLADRAAAITSLTRGHTLFVIESMRSLADGPDPGDDVRQLAIPQSLRDAVTGRAHRCGADVEELLRAAVAIGSAFDVTLVAELLGVSGEEVVARAEPARRAGILVEAGGGYEFSNDLIRDVLYDTTPRPLRVVRHRRLAALLADQPEAAAGHAAAAGDTRLAVTQWLAAAERAVRAFANREAEQLLSLALDAGEQLDDEHIVAEVRLLRGRARLSLGHYGAAADDLVEAEHLAHALGANDIEAIALTEQGWAAYHAREIPRAEELGERAAANPSAGPRAAILVGRVRGARGNLDGSVTILRSVAEATGDPADRAYALSCLGTALAHSDRYDEAMPVLEEAVAACRRSGVLRGLLNARMFGAIVHANVGRFGPALQWADQLDVDARRFDAAYYHPRAMNTLALIWRELGDAGRSSALAEEALETSSTPEGQIESEPAANALLALAESALAAGDDAAAALRLDDITPLLSERVAYAWRIELRRLEILSRIDSSKSEELLTLSREFGSAKYQALALAYLGSTEEAVAMAQGTGSAWLLARVAPEPLAQVCADELVAQLPGDLRDGFVTQGPLLSRWRRS
jgi:DNA-binding SARP family transcriptional activator